jgi:hypothetical protein
MHRCLDQIKILQQCYILSHEFGLDASHAGTAGDNQNLAARL